MEKLEYKSLIIVYTVLIQALVKFKYDTDYCFDNDEEELLSKQIAYKMRAEFGKERNRLKKEINSHI